jgi:hypothetical protein
MTPEPENPYTCCTKASMFGSVVGEISKNEWRDRYIARLVFHGLDVDFATADFEAAEDSHDYDNDPEDSADDELFYMGEG